MNSMTNQSQEHWITIEDRYASGVIPKQPLVITRGQGARLWDVQGHQYIDCGSGHGVANIGHANPAIREALTRQAEQLITAPGDFYHQLRAQLLAELVRIAPGNLERVFLANSGTEAVEGALKFARLTTGRSKFISTMRGFHGRSMGALSATWEKNYREPFQPLIPGFEFVPYNHWERMEEAVDDQTAGVILEIVQGEGGVHPGQADYLQQVQELCRQRGALLIIDEVQTGFGRTGKMFACQHYDLEPDLMTVAKAIAGGLPMGAVLLGPRIGRLPSKVHGTTFGGNALACAAALATIKYLENHKLPERAADLGNHFLLELRKLKSPLIREVRGLGLMVGLQLKTRSGSYLAKLAEPVDGLGVLGLTAGSTVMRFLPPLVIDQEDLDLVVERVGRVLGETA